MLAGNLGRSGRCFFSNHLLGRFPEACPDAEQSPGRDSDSAKPASEKGIRYEKVERAWYGWPDFMAGQRIENESLLAQYPNKPSTPLQTFGLNSLKAMIVSPENFSTYPVALFADNAVVSVAKSDIEVVARPLEGELKQIKFGPDDKLYVLLSDGKISSLYSIEPVNKPHILGTSSAKTLSGTWFLNSLAMMGGLGAVYMVWRRQRPA